jgi:site-specific DNA recombinase
MDIGYYRVSTDEQSENGYGLARQQRNVREFSKDQLVAEFTEDISGTVYFFDRPGGKELIEFAKTHKADRIIVDTVDRATRPEKNEAEYIAIKYQLDRFYGLKLIALDSPSTGDSFVDNINGLAKAKGAKEEREKIINRTRAGRLDKAREGKILGGGYPYGYTQIRKAGNLSNTKLVINEIEAEVVKNIFYLYTQKRLPIQEIARELTRQSAPTRASKHVNQWSVSQIKRILDKPCYIGEFYYGGIKIDLPELAIVDRDTFDEAKKQRDIAKKISARNSKHDYLLSGMIFCKCGNKLCGMSGTCYRCNTLAYRELSNCRSAVVIHKLDKPAWEWVQGLISDDDLLEASLAKIAERNAKVLQPKRDKLESLKEQLKIIESRIGRAVADVQNEDDSFIRAEKEKGLDDLKARRKYLADEIVKIKAELSQEITPETVTGIKATIQKIRARLNGNSFQDKRWILARVKFEGRLLIEDGVRKFFMQCQLDEDGKTVPIDSQASY